MMAIYYTCIFQILSTLIFAIFEYALNLRKYLITNCYSLSDKPKYNANILIRIRFWVANILYSF